MSFKNVLVFCFLVCAWGSSFYWLKISLRDIDPLSTVTLRICIAAVALYIFMKSLKKNYPRSIAVWGRLALLSFFSIILPFLTLSWALSKIPSGLAGVINGTIPLFTVLAAHLFLQDEKLTQNKILGLALGFLGSLFLIRASSSTGHFDLTSFFSTSSTLGAFSALLSSVFYGLGAVTAKKTNKGLHSTVAASTATTIAALFFIFLHIFSWLVGHPLLKMPSVPMTWAALSWLGIIGSCFAYASYYYLISAIGASRASFVMYLSPAVALLLGILLLGESANINLFIGTALVLLGIAATNIKWKVDLSKLR